jgi:glycosyltransferase involved in cell wall biosynthesis
MEREMVDFFAVARTELENLLLVVITQADRAPALTALESRGIDPADYRITSAPSDQIGRYLAAADVGIAFIRPCLSKISSSPTKVGEYLGAGLPVVSGPGIGDLDELLSSEGVGALVPAFGPEAYRAAAKRVAELLRDPETAARCNALAHRDLSLEEVGVPRYDRLYRELAQRAAK